MTPKGQYSHEVSLIKKLLLKRFCTAVYEWRKNTELVRSHDRFFVA